MTTSDKINIEFQIQLENKTNPSPIDSTLNKTRPLNYVSLFSSSGVGCYGFKQEKFDGVATAELIKRRLDVQKHNKKMVYNKGYILGDITEKHVKRELFDAIDYYKKNKRVSEIDVVIFTAPCQGMSVANHKKDSDTITQNSLVVEALEIVKEIQPRFFISENVRSYMNTKCVDHGKQKKIKQAFSDWLSNDYEYEHKILNFKNYGANSSRTRSLIIGVRKDLLDYIKPHQLFPDEEPEKNLIDVIGHLPPLSDMGEIDEKGSLSNSVDESI